jgi:hypothetical protein
LGDNVYDDAVASGRIASYRSIAISIATAEDKRRLSLAITIPIVSLPKEPIVPIDTKPWKTTSGVATV